LRLIINKQKQFTMRFSKLFLFIFLCLTFAYCHKKENVEPETETPPLLPMIQPIS